MFVLVRFIQTATVNVEALMKLLGGQLRAIPPPENSSLYIERKKYKKSEILR